MTQGLILYRAPSLIDGGPILCLATRFDRVEETANRKTGQAVQVYIIRSDMAPLAAMRVGYDRSVCGDCVLRPAYSKACYVDGGKGLWNVWQGVLSGAYSEERDLERFRGRFVRIGAYGDPAAVPFEVWRDIVAVAKNWTAYTHGWRMCDERLKSICMASVESVEEAAEAKGLGWRTFRVRLPEEDVEHDEIVCPSSDEGGNRRQCTSCRACRGFGHEGQRSVAIVVHGRTWKINRFRELKMA